MTTALTIASTSIRQDEHGRFCLNDLHKASGGEKHKLLNWFRSQQTQELIAEIERDTLIAHFRAIEAKAGRYGGTYVVEELAFAYAMWVSPKFHLTVIRAFKQMITSGRPAAAPTHDLSTIPRSQMLDRFQLLLTHERDAEAKRCRLRRFVRSLPVR